MNVRFHFWSLLTGFLMLWTSAAVSGQVPGIPSVTRAQTDTQGVRQLKIDHADFAEQVTQGLRQFQRLYKIRRQVVLRQNDLLIFCDTAMLEGQLLVAKGNLSLQQGDSVRVWGDSIIYRSDTKLGQMYGECVLQQNKQKLYAKDLYYDANTKVGSYTKGATLTDGTATLISRKGFYHTETRNAFFKDSVVLVHPDFTMNSDTLEYDLENRRALFRGPTMIRQKEGSRIYTESGYYDVNTSQALFDQSPQYVDGDKKAAARIMRYNGKTKEILLEGEARFTERDRKANANSILYKEESKEILLRGVARYQDSIRNIAADTIAYNQLNNTYTTQGRTKVIDGPRILDADGIRYNNQAGMGQAFGHVVWQDTVERVTLLSEQLLFGHSGGYVKSWGDRPLLLSVIDQDTMYMRADTLISIADSLKLKYYPLRTNASDGMAGESPISIRDSIGRIPGEIKAVKDTIVAGPVVLDTLVKKQDTRSLLAYHKVRIYKSNLQAICDSLSYSSQDSLFRLYHTPLLWSDTTQFSADTVAIRLAQNKIEQVILQQNAFLNNSPDEVYFNQVKGDMIRAFFIESQLRRMRVIGSAASVYYVKDDNGGYTGVNKTQCKEMVLLFGDNKVKDIRFYAQPKGQYLPMGQTDHQKLKLEGFLWEFKKRPKGPEDL